MVSIDEADIYFIYFKFNKWNDLLPKIRVCNLFWIGPCYAAYSVHTAISWMQQSYFLNILYFLRSIGCYDLDSLDRPCDQLLKNRYNSVGFCSLVRLFLCVGCDQWTKTDTVRLFLHKTITWATRAYLCRKKHDACLNRQSHSLSVSAV